MEQWKHKQGHINEIRNTQQPFTDQKQANSKGGNEGEKNQKQASSNREQMRNLRKERRAYLKRGKWRRQHTAMEVRLQKMTRRKRAETIFIFGKPF